jgi:hypothetical protein
MGSRVDLDAVAKGKKSHEPEEILQIGGKIQRRRTKENS